MKKFISALLTLALLFGLAVPTTAYAAEDTVTVYANDTANVIAENVKDGYMENQGLYEETTGYYGLKPADDTLGAAKLYFSVDIETAGQYEIVVAYAAKTGDAARKCDVYIDDTLSQALNLTMNADWETKSEAKFRVNLTAGEHDIVIATPSDYDNSSVKTPNIYGVKYTLKQAAAPVAETTTIWVGDDIAQDAELVSSENLFDPYQTNRLYEGHGCHGIKPADTTLPAKVTFSVDVETAGRYELVLLYSAKTGDALRKVDVYVNDVLANNCTVTMQADWETVAEHKIFVNLKAGENDVTLASSADYDGSSVKNINIYGIKYTLKQAAETPAVPTTPEEIVNALYALEDNQSLEGEYTLTGVIKEFKYTYSPDYSTIQLTIVVGDMTDKPVVCYKLGGEGIDKVEVGDTITVTGPLKNYKGMYEFNGCTLVSYEKPGDEPVVTPDEPIVVEGTEYVVQSGDTLGKIAAACGATVKELAEANKIENPDLIRVGTKLVIPTFEVKRHIIKSGDTLNKIAKANGCTVADILKVNTIENPDLIIIGDVIVLP